MHIVAYLLVRLVGVGAAGTAAAHLLSVNTI